MLNRARNSVYPTVATSASNAERPRDISRKSPNPLKNKTVSTRPIAKMFTLVEMLVAIAIIAVLSCLLLPALGKARETGKRIVCVNNFKQLHTALMYYAGDYNSYLPRTANSAHVFTLSEYLKSRYDLRYNISGTYYATVIAWSRPVGVFFCPAVPLPERSPCWNGSAIAPYYMPNYTPTTNNISWTIPSGGWSANVGALFGNTPRRLDQISDGSAIMGEQNFFSASGQLNVTSVTFAAQDVNLPATFYYAPGWIHVGVTNFLFKDGHCGAFKYNGKRQFGNSYDGNPANMEWAPK